MKKRLQCFIIFVALTVTVAGCKSESIFSDRDEGQSPDVSVIVSDDGKSDGNSEGQPGNDGKSDGNGEGQPGNDGKSGGNGEGQPGNDGKDADSSGNKSENAGEKSEGSENDGKTENNAGYTVDAGGDSENMSELTGDEFSENDDELEIFLLKVKNGYSPRLLISEAMSSNSKYSAVGGEYYDWIELYNNSEESILLSDYYLTDKLGKPEKFRLPRVNLAPGEYHIIYCSGEEGENQAPFKISADGEDIFLFSNGYICDYLPVPADLEKNKSFGRVKDKNVYMDTPTPGKKNKKGYATAFAAPSASVPAGLYDKAFTVELTGEGEIHYTLDGSHPSAESPVYTEGIEISDVTCLRAVSIEGKRISAVSSFSYLIDVNHTLPVVTVSIPETDLRGSEGILDQITKSIEKEAVITLFENGEEKFSVPCGFRLHGNDSRKGAKQNFQIRFRSKYGMGKLHYKLFENSEIDVFNSLLLKGGSEDYVFAMMRDELCTGIVNGKTELSVLDCKPCVLYLGDRYWGIYFIRERFSSDYVASHFNVSKDSVDLLFTMGSVQDGSAKDYNTLVNFVKNHDLRDEENYKYVLDRVEITSLMDWYICRSYMGDKDYANVRFFKSSEYDNKWRWMYFDLDWSFWSSKDTPVSSILSDTKLNVLIYNLMKNDDFKDKFLKRYNELMESVLNEESFNAEVDRYVEMLTPEMPADRERWGYTVSRWNSEVEKIRKILKDNGRTKNVLKDIKNHFNLSDEDMKEYFPQKESLLK